MATTAAFEISHSTPPGIGARIREGMVLVLAAGLPLGFFGLANLAGEAMGLMPLFFAPFGIAGWAGAALHLSLLPLVGLATGLAARAGGRHVVLWGVVLLAGIIAFPFVAQGLDSLQLSIFATSLLLLAGATTFRVSRLSPLAGLVMVPVLIWLGISAALGLALAASWSPPFALMQGQNNGMPPPA